MAGDRDIALDPLSSVEARPRPRVATARGVVLASFLACLFLVELVVRAWPVERFPAAALPSLLLRKAAWLARQPAPEILVLGDSTGHRGVAIEAFQEGAGGATALNGAITSGSPIVVRAMTRDLGWRPKQIVLTLSPFILSDSWSSEPHEVEVADFSERAALIGYGPAIVSTTWQTYRRRAWLRSSVKRALFPGAPMEGLDFGPRTGREDAYGALAVVRDAADTDAAEAKWRSWTRDGLRIGARAAALEALASRWKADEVEVAYVLMPVTARLRALGERDPAAWSFQERWLLGLVARAGGRVIDCRAAVPDPGFYDVDHLRKGSEREAFSRRLGALVEGAPGALEASGCRLLGGEA